MSDLITLAHGAGGKQTAELIDRVFKAHFQIPSLPGTMPLFAYWRNESGFYDGRLHRVAA